MLILLELGSIQAKTKGCITIHKTNLHQRFAVFRSECEYLCLLVPSFWNDFRWFWRGSQIQHTRYSSAEIWDFMLAF